MRVEIDGEFCLLSGEDATAVAYLAQGGDGCISVTANVAPRAVLGDARGLAEGRRRDACGGSTSA